MSDQTWTEILGFFGSYRVPLLIAATVGLTALNTALLTLLVRRATNRILTQTSTRPREDARARAAQDQLARRTRTASTVAVNLIVWVQVGIAVMVVLGILGVNLTAILASAGVLAAVLTFGAQNIIKDVLSGLFMVFEDQLDVGDIVDTGFGTGVVEAVGIRVTQVRDLNGTLWSIRNGEIIRIGNSTRSWHRVVLELAFSPDVDEGIAQDVVVRSLAAALAASANPNDVRSAPQYAGVLCFDGSATTLRFTVEVAATAAIPLGFILRSAAREAILGHDRLHLAAPLRVESSSDG